MNATSQPHDEPAAKEKVAVRIGELLIREGYVHESTILKALKIQEQERTQTGIPVGQILVNMGVLSEDDLQSTLTHPKLRKNIGSLAVEKGLITKKELLDAITNQEKGQQIGEKLVECGLLTKEDVKNLLKQQIDSSKLGELLIELKLITDKDLQQALRKQKSSRPLGEILIDMKAITPVDLYTILEKHNKQIGIENIFLRLGFVSQEKIDLSLEEAKDRQKPLEEILLRKKLINQEQLFLAYSSLYNLPFDPLTDFNYTSESKINLTNLISQKYAEKNSILPISLEKQQLTVAVCDPTHIKSVSEIKRIFKNLETNCILVTEAKFQELFEILFSKSIVHEEEDINKAEEDIEFLEIDLNEDIDDTQSTGSLYATNDMEAQEIVNFIIKYGITNNASDIHVEQDQHGASVRYRIDGVLQKPDISWLNNKVNEKINAIISRIKVISGLDIAERRLPQDGVFRLNYFDKSQNNGFNLDFRVATCRAIAGENVTIRILDQRKANVDLKDLNHSPHVLKPFQTLLKSSAGMVLVTGPTGSGKSSTLYGALRHIYNPGIKIITAEDPVEYSFPGVMQTQTLGKIGLSFSRLLRSFLRFDPDVILVGEMRDEETTTIGFDAAQTGHLVLSTLHTNDAISAIQRMKDLGIDNTQIASCVLCVLAQRLVRRICSFCKREYIPEEDEWNMLFDSYPIHLNFFHGEGCEACNYTGYKGRILLSEIFVIDKEMGGHIIQGKTDREIKRLATESGMKSIVEDGLLKLNDTTLYEIIRMAPYDMIETFRHQHGFQQKATTFINHLFEDGKDNAHLKLEPEDFALTNPETEGDIIEQMFKKYTTYGLLDKNEEEKVDINLFKTFVCDNFHAIREQHNCSRILFTIGLEDGKSAISAVPVL